MFDKLELTEKRFDEVNEKLMDPNVISDNEQYKQLMKEYKSLTVIVEKFRAYKEQKASFDEAKEMLNDGGLDKDFKEIVQMKIKSRRNNQKAVIQPEEFDKLESQVRILKDIIGEETK